VGAWVVLAGALGGVALTGALGLVTAAQTHRWNERTRVQTADEQEARDLRDQRRQVFHSYLVATSEFYLAVDQVYLESGRGEQFDPHEDRKAEMKALLNAYVDLTITAGAEVRERARVYNEALYALKEAAQQADQQAWSELVREMDRARHRLREAMRAELGISDGAPQPAL
jgi:hypothetical protein